MTDGGRDGTSWRDRALARLADGPLDVLVIGAGATGAAIARDAALRGLSVGLVDRGDFAGETSGKSSKLIHGGIRYLQYGNFGLIFEALRERHILMTTAPHLCRPVEFLFPGYRGQWPSLATLGTGIALYDALALWRAPVRSRRLDAHEVYVEAPLLRSEGLLGAHVYVDCQTDDVRLVLEHVIDAERAGAAVASHVSVSGLVRDHAGKTRSVRAVDRIGGGGFEIAARAFVNATGPFSDALEPGRRLLRPTMGVHVTLNAARLPTGGRAVVIHSPRDGRLMFALPAGARTIVGTTDTDWTSEDGSRRPPRPGDLIRARSADVDYLLEAANHGFPPAGLRRADVISAWAGLRPLIASSSETPSATSREHEIRLDWDGVLTVAGGKLTTMRAMAEEAVDRLADVLRDRGFDGPIGPCVTRAHVLPGAELPSDLGHHELGADVREHLLATYGGRAPAVLALAARDAALTRRIEPDLPYLWVEVSFAARYDHAVELDDVLARRVPLLRDARDGGLGAAPRAAEIMGRELGWSAERRARSLAAYKDVLRAQEHWRERAPEARGLHGNPDEVSIAS